jgi:hypothetical protein
VDDLTVEEMGAILAAHGMAEIELDLAATMATVVPDPHYELPALDLAIDGWDAVQEMYRRLLLGNRHRNLQPAGNPRIVAAARNALINEARASFDDAQAQRVTGQYMVVVDFDPVLKQVIGERMYTDTVFTAMWAENLGPDFIDVPGVSRISERAA